MSTRTWRAVPRRGFRLTWLAVRTTIVEKRRERGEDTICGNCWSVGWTQHHKTKANHIPVTSEGRQLPPPPPQSGYQFPAMTLDVELLRRVSQSSTRPAQHTPRRQQTKARTVPVSPPPSPAQSSVASQGRPAASKAFRYVSAGSLFCSVLPFVCCGAQRRRPHPHPRDHLRRESTSLPTRSAAVHRCMCFHETNHNNNCIKPNTCSLLLFLYHVIACRFAQALQRGGSVATGRVGR